jgi:pimeloyl-ACP methyl ester carboxylesterase
MQGNLFELPFGPSLLRGDRYPGDCRAIVLHGAGQSSRERFSRLRRSLNEKGLATAGFDFVGHGETGGSLPGSTLHARTDQAAAVIRQTCHEPLTLIAASMGAYTAIRLLEAFAVENLILLVPAVYTHRAYDLPFGPAFSAAIRRPGSWRESDAFGILSIFRGNLLIIAAESDDVIPRGVIDGIFAAATNARHRRLHIVPSSRHLGLFPHDQDFRRATDMITDMCRGARDKRPIE